MKQFKLKNGKLLTIRRAETADAPDLFRHLKTIFGESDFLINGIFHNAYSMGLQIDN